MGWLAHDRLGFNYRLTDLQAALGVAQLERVDELLGERARVAALYGERLAAIGAGPAGEGDPDGLVLPCADRGAERRSWFVYVVQLPEGADRDAVIAALAERGVAAKAYMPCIHLMPHYRERFGYREGRVPGRRAGVARARWRCRSSPRWARRRWKRVTARAGRRAGPSRAGLSADGSEPVIGPLGRPGPP